MHLRGKSKRSIAPCPSGRSEVLISVPRHDFRRQRIYELDTPIPLPKGTRLEVLATYDNSPHNPDNAWPHRHGWKIVAR
jgi:hypothetical protein